MKKIYIIVFVTLSFLLMPSATFACGGGKDSCKKEMSSSKTEKKDCCGNKENSKDKDHKGCKGKCGHSECSCSSTCPASSVSFLSEINFKNNMFSYSSIRKVKFLYATPSISDGFYSIWLIPKIS